MILQRIINAEVPHPMQIFMTSIQHICRPLSPTENRMGDRLIQGMLLQTLRPSLVMISKPNVIV
jgi:hypothetical protein